VAKFTFKKEARWFFESGVSKKNEFGAEEKHAGYTMN
jgi:hypothetical protein